MFSYAQLVYNSIYCFVVTSLAIDSQLLSHPTYLHRLNVFIINLGMPLAPDDLTYLINYNKAMTTTDVNVTLMWSADAGGLRGVSVEYTLLLTDSSHNSLTTHTTDATNWTTSLQFNETYLVTLYSSTCDHTLISDNITTNITIEECMCTINLNF